MYYCYKPAEQHEVGRELRTSSIYDKLKANGGQFQQVFGWERARWYDPSGKGEQYSFRRSNWWDAVEGEAPFDRTTPMATAASLALLR